MRQAETSQTERPHLGPLPPQAGEGESGALHVFLVFLRLGLTSFGGPVAHLGFFRTAFVERRRWLTAAAYADLVALCQFLPGPASSQVGIAIGHIRAGLAGAFAAWVAFTAPSVLRLWGFARGADLWQGPVGQGALRGLKDTRVPMYIACFGYWVVGFPLAALLGFWVGWGGVGIWLGLAAGLAMAAALLYRRVQRQLGTLPSPAAPPPAVLATA